MLSFRIRIHQRLPIPTTKSLSPTTRPLISQPHKPHATLRQLTTNPTTNMTDNNHPIATGNISSSAPGENFEPRQTHTSEDYTPDPSKSIPLSPNRQALVDDIIDLYSCKPTVEKVKRYTPDCVYDDQFVYANDRYKMAGQWFALPKLFKDSKNEGYQIVKNEPGLIQFRNAQVSFPLIHSPIAQENMLTQVPSVLDIQNHSQNRHNKRPRLPLARAFLRRLRLYSRKISQRSGQ